MSRPETDRARLLAQVETLRWIHCIDVGEGVVTPGRWGADPQPDIIRAMDAIDFHGKKVLDVGCWDGLWSFEAERRGAAEVHGIDLVTQRFFEEDSTFLVAKALRGSNAHYHPDLSVYDVERLGIRDFDVVIYPGVYYHLKDPLLSFARLRRVMREGASLIVEGAVIDAPGCYAEFFYREPYLTDYSNWWVPTVPCLRQWVECNYFEIGGEYGLRESGPKNLRFTLSARAVRRADPHYIRPPEGLAEFDLNTYPRKFSDPIPTAEPAGHPRGVPHPVPA